MESTYINPDALINVAEGIIKQAKRDFIKGAKILYARFERIPTSKENDKLNGLISKDIQEMYDAWNFVEKDPYDLFGSVESHEIINQWKRDAIIDYYRGYYIDGAAEILKGYKMCKGKKFVIPELYSINDEDLVSKIEDEFIRNTFIRARNYIFSIDRKDLLSEWTKTAYERVRKIKLKDEPKMAINQIDYQKDRQKTKERNINTAIELFNSGMSIRAIAKYMRVSESTIYNYVNGRS